MPRWQVCFINEWNERVEIGRGFFAAPEFEFRNELRAILCTADGEWTIIGRVSWNEDDRSSTIESDQPRGHALRSLVAQLCDEGWEPMLSPDVHGIGGGTATTTNWYFKRRIPDE